MEEEPTIPSTRASALESLTRSESKMLSLQSFLREGVSLGYVGSIENLKDLKLEVLAAADARGAVVQAYPVG